MARTHLLPAEPRGARSCSVLKSVTKCWRVRPVIETVLRDLNLTPLFSKCGIVLHLQDSVALRKRSVAFRTSSLMKPEHGRRGRASAEANFFRIGVCRSMTLIPFVDPHPKDRISRLRDAFRISALALVMVVLGIKSTPAVAAQEYLLGPGDIVRISVFKNPDLSLDARVSEVGAIAYPLVGSVPVGGLTLPAAERKIGQMLKDGGFVLHPQVNILLTQALGNLVSVIGEVNSPGRYSLETTGGHLSGMLAAAGGIAQNG